jgi:hypothetical protein
MNILQEGNEIPPSGPAPDYSAGYGIVPIAGWPTAEVPAFPLYLQWQGEGVDLGGRGVRVVNLVTDPTVWIVTRGVGEQSNVITIGAAPVIPVPPQGRAYLESDPYPIMLLDSAALTADVDGGWCVQFFPKEGLGLTATVVSGDVTVTISYTNYSNWKTFDPDKIGLTADIVSGEVVVTIAYVTYDKWRIWDPDKVGLTADIASGTLEVVIAYITYSNGKTFDPDKIALTADIVSGTLS